MKKYIDLKFINKFKLYDKIDYKNNIMDCKGCASKVNLTTLKSSIIKRKTRFNYDRKSLTRQYIIKTNSSLGSKTKFPSQNFEKEWENIEDNSWQYPIVSYIDDMKEKVITIKPKGISQKQWANLLLELNLVKKSWKP